MNAVDPRLTALQFNEYINRQDIGGLAGLMTQDHTFVDRKGEIDQGRETMTQGWIDFFESFPDYRNNFERVESRGNLVVLYGYATWEKGADPDKADRFRGGPMIIAAESGQLDMIRLLLAHGADVNVKRRLGGAPLWYAAKAGHKEFVKLLLEKGAYPRAFNYSQTAAEVAARSGHRETADLIRSYENRR